MVKFKDYFFRAEVGKLTRRLNPATAWGFKYIFKGLEGTTTREMTMAYKA